MMLTFSINLFFKHKLGTQRKKEKCSPNTGNTLSKCFKHAVQTDVSAVCTLRSWDEGLGS